MNHQLPHFRDARFTWLGVDNRWHYAPYRASREQRDWLSANANTPLAEWIETPNDSWGWNGRLLIKGGPFADPGPFDADAPEVGWYCVKFAAAGDRDA